MGGKNGTPAMPVAQALSFMARHAKSALPQKSFRLPPRARILPVPPHGCWPRARHEEPRCFWRAAAIMCTGAHAVLLE